MKSPEILGLLGCLALALALRAAFVCQADVVTPDEAYNIRTAQDLCAGRPFLLPSDHRRQPFPVMLFSAAVFLGGDAVSTCRWASVLIGALALLPFHACVRKFADTTGTLIADALFATVPFGVQYSLLAVNHALFNFFYLLLFWALLNALESGKKRWFAAAGFAAWCATMSRAEGWCFAAVFAVALCPILWRAGRRGALGGALLFAGTVIALSLPFWFWLAGQTGHWQWTFVNKEPGAWRGAWEAVSSPRDILGLYARGFADMDKGLPRVFPIFLWIAAAFGFVHAARPGGDRRGVALALVFMLLPLLFYPLVTVEMRRLHPALLVVLMFAGPGLGSLAQVFSRRRTALAALCVMALLSFAPGYAALSKSFAEEPGEQRLAGEWIRNRCVRPQTLCASDVRSAFYAGPACGGFVSIGRAEQALRDGGALHEFLISKGVDVLIADSRYIRRYHPSLAFLLDAEGATGLSVMARLQWQGEEIVLIDVSGNHA